MERRFGRGIPPIVVRLGWVSFFTDAASEMIYPLLPALLSSLGAAPIWLGAMEGIAEAIGAAVKWWMGPVVDRSPRKKPLVVAGYGIATFVRPLVAFAGAGWHVVVVRAVDRVGKGVRGVPRDALVAAAADPQALATAFAFHRMMDNAGSVLGPVLAFALLRGLALDLRTVLALAIVPGLCALAMLLFGVHEEAPRASAASTPEREEAVVAAPSSLPPDVLRYLAVLGIFTLGSSADSFLLLRAVDLGMRQAWVPLLWLALSASKAASNVPGGLLGDALGRRATLVIAWVLYAAIYALAPSVQSVWIFAALVVLYGLYYGLAEGSERAVLAERAPAEQRGRAFGAMHAVTGVAVLPANLVFGILYEKRPALAFHLGAACAGLAAVLLVVVVRTQPQSSRSAP